MTKRDCVFLSGLLLLLVVFPVTAHAAPPAQAPDTPPSVSGGRQDWGENCAPCHGPTGRGDGPTAQAIDNPVANFTDLETARQLIPAQNFETIKNGRIEKMMPPWGQRFNDKQIWDLTALVWYFSTTPNDLAAGEAIYRQQCATCHGETGAGDGPEASASINDFTDLETMTQVSQNDLFINFDGVADPHAELNLSEPELWQTLDYIRTFSFAVPQRNGVLTGQATNATTQEPAANIDVTLRVFDGSAEVETLTAQTDAEGNYTFRSLPTDHGLFYIVEGRYQDVTYRSDSPTTFNPNSTEASLDLNVYGTTSDPADVSLTQLHYIDDVMPEAVVMVQVFVVGNDGDLTYIGDQNGQTFRFGLPAAATNVNFQGDSTGARFIPTEDGYADTEPIVPGEEGLTVAVTYDLPYSGDMLAVEVPLPAEAASINLLMGAPAVDFESEQLEFVETREFQGSTFSIFRGTDLGQDETLSFNLSNLSEVRSTATSPGVTATTNLFDQNLARWLIIGLGGLTIVVAGVVYPLMRSPAAQQTADLTTRRQRLLVTLVRLDEAFENGELDEAVYRQARAEYKAELVRIMEN